MFMGKPEENPFPMSDIAAEISEEILLNATRLVTQRAGASMEPEGEIRLRHAVRETLPSIAGNIDFADLARELDNLAAGALAAGSQIYGKSSTPSHSIYNSWDTTPEAGVALWSMAIKDSAERLTEESFTQAADCFQDEKPLEGTQYLKAGVISSMTGIAALRGWEFGSELDCLKAVVRLATGEEPQEGKNLFRMLQSASDKGQTLNSVYAAALGQPDEVKFGAFYDSASGSDENALQYAHQAVILAKELAAETLLESL